MRSWHASPALMRMAGACVLRGRPRMGAGPACSRTRVLVEQAAVRHYVARALGVQRLVHLFKGEGEIFFPGGGWEHFWRDHVHVMVVSKLEKLNS